MSIPFKIRHLDQTSVLSISNRLDMKTVLKVDELLKEIPAENVLKIDFSGCEYVDSAGLGSLLRIRSAFQKTGQSIILANCSEKIMHIFQVMNFNNLFEFEN